MAGTISIVKAILMFGRAFYNTAAQLLGRIISAAIGFATTLILAQTLGLANYGEFIKITAFISLFYPAVDLGLNAVYLRDYKKDINQKLGGFIGLRIFLGGLWLLVSLFLIHLISYINPAFSPVTRLGVVVAGLALPGYGAYLAVTAYFQNRERLDVVAALSTLGNVVTLALIVATAHVFSQKLETGAVLAIGMTTAGTVFSGGLGILLTPRRLLKQFQPLPSWTSQIIKRAWPLGLTLVLNIIYFRADTLILASFLGNAAVGAYGLAYKFFEFVLVIPTFFMNSLYPNLVDQKSSRSLWPFFQKMVLLMLVVGSALAMMTFMGAGLLPLVRSEYTASVPILKILSLGVPVFFVTSPLMWFMVLQQQVKPLLYIYATAAALNIVLNLVFVPHYGSQAAAVITAATEVLVLILELGYIKHLKLWQRQTN